MHNAHQTVRHTQTNLHYRVYLSMHYIPVDITHQRTNALNYMFNSSHHRYLAASQIHFRNDFTLSRYISLIQSLVSCRNSIGLLTCLHFEIRSVLILGMLFPLNNVVCSSSFKQRLHPSNERLKLEHFFRIFHFVRGTEFLHFNFQNSFDSSVSFLQDAKLKDLLWLLYLFLRVVSAVPT